MKQALRRSIKQYYWVSCNAPKRIGMKGRCVVYRVNMPFMCSEEAARKYLKRTFVGDALQHIEYVVVKRLQYIQCSNDLLLFSNYVAYLHVPIECVEAFTTSCNNSVCAALDRKD